MVESFKDLKAGDDIFIIGHQFGSRPNRDTPTPVAPAKVVKVGRKYLTVLPYGDNGEMAPEWHSMEFERESGWIKHDKNYSGRATRRLYRSQEDFEQERRRGNLAKQFTDHFRGFSAAMSPEATIDDILQAAKLLRIELKEEIK